jgi:hypothetical protein
LIKGDADIGTGEFHKDSWVAFRPEQIKSATGNNGDFDPANPDITRSTVRTVQVDGVRYPDRDSKDHVIAPIAGGGMQGQINFWRWFRGSKVVDAAGRPLVVYRGQTSDAQPGPIAYFSADPRHTTGYAGTSEWHGTQKDGGNVIPAYLSMKNPLEITNEDYWKVIRKGEAAEKALAAKAKADGHDGIIVRGFQDTAAPADMFITVDERQIKSATGNSGQYDPTTGDITQSTPRSLFNPGFNPKLPRGTVNEPTQAELDLEKELAAAEKSASDLWAAGKKKDIERILERITPAAKKHDIDDETLKSMANSMFFSERQRDAESPSFAEYREAEKQVQALRERRMDMIADRIGPPEFESMRQLSDFQRPITDTENFKRWFDGSKVVGKDGKPLIVFHGTNRDFSQFRTVLPGDKQVSNNNWMGELGSWFAAPSASGEYDEGNAEFTAEVFAGLRSRDDEIAEGATVYPVFLSIKNPYETETYEDISEQRDDAGGGKAFREMLIADGYDGVVIRESNTDGGQYRDDWIAFYPEQIKSALGNNGDFDPKNGDITRSAARPQFYSQLQRAIEGVPDRLATMAAPQWKLWLDANAAKLGVKKDELEWSGLKDWLAMRGKDKLTRDEVAAFVRDNGVQVKDVVLGLDSALTAEERQEVRELNDLYRRSEGGEEGVFDASDFNRLQELEMRNGGRTDVSKYEKYTVPGGENYREVLITLPSRSDRKPTMRKQYRLVVGGDVIRVGDEVARDRWVRNGELDTPGTEVEEVMLPDQETRLDRERSGDYTSNHWDEPNILAHLRVDDRTDVDGKRVLFVNEIQSDWAQEGRKRGFSADAHSIVDPELGAIPQQSQVPSAPFVTDTKAWVSLALKRATIMAVEGGYDRVAFITGKQAADLYDLSKQVDRIDYHTFRDPAKNTLEAVKDGEIVVSKAALPEELPDLIGKDAAERLLKQKDYYGQYTLEGEDLKVGGQGMLAFYDKIVPQVANDILKKVGGGKVGEVAFPSRFDLAERDGGWVVIDTKTGMFYRGDQSTSLWTEKYPKIFISEATAEKAAQALDAQEDGPGVQPGFDITPKMREELAGGMPLFSTARQVTETPEFKRWFGKSMVTVDGEPGSEPQVMYHGTHRGGFTVFDRKKTTEWRRPSMDTIGSWFSDNPSDDGGAGMYASGEDASIYPVYLRAERPKVYDSFRQFLKDMHEAEGRELPDSAPGLGSAEGLHAKLKAQGYDSIAFMRTDNAKVHAQIEEVMQQARAIRWSEPKRYQQLLKKADALDAEIEGSRSTEFDKQLVYVVFDPEQVKSAVGNNGSFDPESADITRSTGRTATGAAWDSPSASKFDDLVYKLQDKHVDTKRIIAAIKDTAGSIADDLNVYLQETLFHGRSAKRTEDFVNDELHPLVEELQRQGLTMADLEEFLHARHAKEANEVIARRNPGVADLQDGGSGMDTAVAQQYLASLDPAERAKLDAAAAKVDAIIARTRQLYVDYELESQDTVNGWSQLFQHYIPLQREDKDGSPGLGQGFSVKGRETKGRTGSKRKVVDILANIAMQRERAIVRGEKNRVSQALVGLATANPNEGFWTVNEVPHERVYDPDKGVVVERADPMYKNRENALVAKILMPDGTVKEHAVLFNEDDERAMRTAAALKNLDAGKLEGMLGLSAKVTRYFAAVNTQYNPVFGVVNLIRDVQSAMLNLGSTPIKGDSRRVAKDALSAVAGIYTDARAVRSGNHPSSQWAKLWEEFQDVGGQTGYRQLFQTSADRADAIKKMLDPNAWMDSKLGKIFTANGALRVPIEVAQKVASWVFNWLSDYNLAMENGVRLAAYKAGLDRGMSKEQAAAVAKELTVNFNRKGQVSQQAGAVYAFFNASVQGTARIAQTLFDMEPGKPRTARLSKAGKTIVYGGLLLGSIQALMLSVAGFGDEDPPQFVRERSLIIPIGGKKYVTIPMPLGYHVIPSLGRIATEFALSGFKDPHRRARDFIGILADSFNPIGNAGLSMQTIAPTALDPLVALSENRDWTGKPIARTSSNKAMPGHLLARDTATSVARALSEGINALSGGNQYVAGVLSPTPDQIDYLIGQVTGGVGRELSKVEQTGLALVRGEELPTHKMPLVGRFYGDAHQQSSEGNSFYANADELNRIETEVKGLRKDGKMAEAQAVLREHPESYLIAMANSAERDLQKLRAQKRDLVSKGAQREQVRAVEERITTVMARLNRAVEKARGQGQ